MARFRLEVHTPTPGVGVLTVQIGSDDLGELVEDARLSALRADAYTQIRIYDRSVELLAVDGFGVPLVEVIDQWAVDQPPLCPECGEMLHAAMLTGEPGWYCRGCDYRALAA